MPALYRQRRSASRAITLLSATSVIAFFPEFFTIVGPLVRDIYLSVGLSFLALLEKPALPIWGAAILATIVLKRHDKIDAACLLLLVTSLGFAAVFFVVDDFHRSASQTLQPRGHLAVSCRCGGAGLDFPVRGFPRRAGAFRRKIRVPRCGRCGDAPKVLRGSFPRRLLRRVRPSGCRRRGCQHAP